MSNKNPLNQFEKGNPGGPGRPSLPDDLKSIRTATKEDLFKAFYKFKNMKRYDLEFLDIEDLSLLELGVSKSFKKFIEDGDYNAIKYPLDQIIGRAKESIDLSSEKGLNININYDLESWKEKIKKRFLEEVEGDGNDIKEKVVKKE
jgi:hypothetical protein